jgi:sensor domain CHASE-containing protein
MDVVTDVMEKEMIMKIVIAMVVATVMEIMADQRERDQKQQ